ncbi:MAG: hypothetical protein ACJAS1_005853 [Oleiphilaceae bacterium]|jgi:hypothetical protein
MMMVPRLQACEQLRKEEGMLAVVAVLESDPAGFQGRECFPG